MRTRTPTPTPTPATLHAYLRRHSITGEQAAHMMFLGGSNQVRKYTGGTRRLSVERWFCLQAHRLLSPEVLAGVLASVGPDLGADAAGQFYAKAHQHLSDRDLALILAAMAEDSELS